MSEIAKHALVLRSVKKHSVRYDAADPANEPALTAVYVMKSALPIPFPQAIVITIESLPTES